MNSHRARRRHMSLCKLYLVGANHGDVIGKRTDRQTEESRQRRTYVQHAFNMQATSSLRFFA